MQKYNSHKFFLIAGLILFLYALSPLSVFAQGVQDDPGGNGGANTENEQVQDDPGGNPGGGGSGVDSKTAPAGKCGENYIELSVPIEDGPDSDNKADNCLQEQLKNQNASQNPIYQYMKTILRFLSAGVGVVVMLMIVISGIQYITSSGNPEAVQSAKKRLTNAILALILFLFMYAILNFLVLGGLLD